MSILIHTSLASHHTFSCPAMQRLSSHLAPKRLLKVTAPSTVLVTLLFLALFVSSCEARRLLIHGAKASSSETPPEPSPCKADGSPANQMKDQSNADFMDGCGDSVDAKVNEQVSMASSGAVLPTPIARRVSRRLSHTELRRVDTAYHLDYDGPMTHSPVHN